MKERTYNREKIQLITEELSISDEIIKASDMIFADIQNKNQTYKYEEQVKKGLLKHEGKETYQLWGYDITLDFTLYYYTSWRVFEEDRNDYKSIASWFDGKTRSIGIQFVSVLGTIFKFISEDALYHELEHCYQWCLNKTNNPNFKELTDGAYEYAMKVLNSDAWGDKKDLAWAIYYANPREQDAFVNEYYSQAMQSPQDYKNKRTEIDTRKEQFQGFVEWLESDYDKPYLAPYMKEYEVFGYSPENILKYVKQGYKRFLEKYSHVYTLLKDRLVDRIPLDKDACDEVVEEVIRRIRDLKR